MLIDLSRLPVGYSAGVGVFSYNLASNLLDLDPNVGVIFSEKNFEYFQNILGAKRFLIIDLEKYKYIDKISLFIAKNFSHEVLNQLFVKIRNLIYRKVGNFAQAGEVIITPTTYLNFSLKTNINLICLHDTQELSLPHLFSPKEIKLRSFLTRFSISNCDLIQVSSNFIKEEILKFYEVDPESIVVIPEGVSMKFLAKRKPTRLQDLNLKRKITIIYPAAAWFHKNHLELLSDLNKSRHSSELIVYFTGYMKNREVELLQFYESLEPKFKLEICGIVDHHKLVELMQLSDFVISYSSYESSSQPILEAMLAKAIPIASSIPAHKEMSNFFRIPLFDLNGEVKFNQLLDTLIENTNLREEILSYNNTRIFSRDWKTIAEEYLKIEMPPWLSGRAAHS